MFQKRVYSQTYGVVGAIIENSGKFLLVQENAPGYHSHGQWNQPAGWIDIGENPIDACIREVKEETGLNFIPTGLLGIYSLVRYDLQKSLSGLPHPIKLIFRGNVTNYDLMQPNEEIMDLKWFSADEIYQMDSPPLRDLDIKTEIEDYLSGKYIDLSFLKHTIQK